MFAIIKDDSFKGMHVGLYSLLRLTQLTWIHLGCYFSSTKLPQEILIARPLKLKEKR